MDSQSVFQILQSIMIPMSVRIKVRNYPTNGYFNQV